MNKTTSKDHDPYRCSARVYDRLVEPFNRVLRQRILHFYPPNANFQVLDIGCGTGTQLASYQALGCLVAGIDSSKSMVKQAKEKLGQRADLQVADAQAMPFEDSRFDMVVMTLTLHEMSLPVRKGVFKEAIRVLRPEGKFLLLDYHVGELGFPRGFFYRKIATVFEILAGPNHYRNFLDFQRKGGLYELVARFGMSIEKKRILGQGNFILMLASKPNRPQKDRAS